MKNNLYETEKEVLFPREIIGLYDGQTDGTSREETLKCVLNCLPNRPLADNE